MNDKEMLEMGAIMGLSNLVIGYDDFEDVLLKYAKLVYAEGIKVGAAAGPIAKCFECPYTSDEAKGEA